MAPMTPMNSMMTSLCMICCLKPKDASLIHGRLGHQVCPTFFLNSVFCDI
jgi:hypothetical protein